MQALRIQIQICPKISAFPLYNPIVSHGNPQPSFLEVITHIVGVQKPSFFKVLGSHGGWDWFQICFIGQGFDKRGLGQATPDSPQSCPAKPW